MTPIRTSADLKEAIRLLELQQDNELLLLKEEWRDTKEKLKPVNLIKSAFKQATDAPGAKTNLLKAAIGLTTGILAKKLFIGKSLNPFSKILGTVLEVFVAKKATKNADNIKSVGSMLINKLFKRKNGKEAVQ